MLYMMQNVNRFCFFLKIGIGKHGKPYFHAILRSFWMLRYFRRQERVKACWRCMAVHLELNVKLMCGEKSIRGMSNQFAGG